MTRAAELRTVDHMGQVVRGRGVELQGRYAGTPVFVRLLHAGDLVAAVTGPLGTPGDVAAERHLSPAVAADAYERELTRLRRGTLTRVTSQTFTVDGRGAGAAQEAFVRAWRAAWAPAVDDLRVRAQTGGPWRVVVAHGWRVQLAAQPWGPGLSDIVAAGVHAHHAAADVALIRASEPAARWLGAYYGGPVFAPPADLADGRDTDTIETYMMALGIWQPHLPGPLAQLRRALDTARTMF